MIRTEHRRWRSRVARREPKWRKELPQSDKESEFTWHQTYATIITLYEARTRNYSRGSGMFENQRPATRPGATKRNSTSRKHSRRKQPTKRRVSFSCNGSEAFVTGYKIALSRTMLDLVETFNEGSDSLRIVQHEHWKWSSLPWTKAGSPRHRILTRVQTNLKQHFWNSGHFCDFLSTNDQSCVPLTDLYQAVLLWARAASVQSKIQTGNAESREKASVTQLLTALSLSPLHSFIRHKSASRDLVMIHCHSKGEELSGRLRCSSSPWSSSEPFMPRQGMHKCSGGGGVGYRSIVIITDCYCWHGSAPRKLRGTATALV